MKRVIGLVIVGLFVVGLFVVGCGSDVSKTEKSSELKAKIASAVQNKDMSYYLGQGAQSITAGDLNSGIRNFDEAIKQDPRSPNGYLALAETYMHVKQYDRAVDTLTAGVTVNPDHGLMNYLLAMSYNYLGDVETAVKYAQRSAIIFRRNNDSENFTKSMAMAADFVNRANADREVADMSK